MHVLPLSTSLTPPELLWPFTCFPDSQVPHRSLSGSFHTLTQHKPSLDAGLCSHASPPPTPPSTLCPRDLLYYSASHLYVPGIMQLYVVGHHKQNGSSGSVGTFSVYSPVSRAPVITSSVGVCGLCTSVTCGFLGIGHCLSNLVWLTSMYASLNARAVQENILQ